MQLSQVRRRAGEKKAAVNAPNLKPYLKRMASRAAAKMKDGSAIYIMFCKMNTLHNIPDIKLPQKLQLIQLSQLLCHAILNRT
jgi:hypothetical protein